MSGIRWPSAIAHAREEASAQRTLPLPVVVPSGSNAFYAIVFLPTDLPGGHFRFRGVYPHARWFSFESYDEALASEGVVAGDAIDPDRGSVDPFLPRQRYHEGHAHLQGRLA